MRLVVYLALAGSLTLCVLVRRESRHMSPPLAALTLAVTALLAAAAWAWNLALLAGTLVGQLTVVAGFGHWSHLALARRDPVPAGAAILAAGLLAVAAATLARRSWRLAGELRSICAAARACPVTTADRVVVVRDPRPRAVAVPGLHGRVLVTTGIVTALDANERRVLFAHERAHLRYRHGEIRLLVRLAASILPLLTPLVAECDYQLERWADEQAASAVADRALVARALARAALAALAASPHRQGGQVLAFAEHAVTRRVQALLTEPSRLGLRRLVVPAFAIAATGLLTVEASRDLEALFEQAMRLWVR